MDVPHQKQNWPPLIIFRRLPKNFTPKNFTLKNCSSQYAAPTPEGDTPPLDSGFKDSIYLVLEADKDGPLASTRPILNGFWQGVITGTYREVVEVCLRGSIRVLLNLRENVSDSKCSSDAFNSDLCSGSKLSSCVIWFWLSSKSICSSSSCK